jgi:hypothetical protein
MKLVLKDFGSQEVVASCNLELTEFGYSIESVTPIVSTLYEEFEEALYAVNNNVTHGVISDGCVDNVPINPYLTFEVVLEIETTTDLNGCKVYCYVINDVEVIDPYVSECGRFDVDPSYYGMTDEQAIALTNANNGD